MSRNARTGELEPPSPGRLLALLVGGAVAFVVILLLASGGCKAYTRYQKRADAKNSVQVTHINISRAHQQAQINRAQIEATKAEAEKRYQESVGIRRAQDEVQQTLTPLYVSHEAIQAQKAVATSGRNNTLIYVPSGPNGVPLVNDIGKQATGR